MIVRRVRRRQPPRRRRSGVYSSPPVPAAASAADADHLFRQLLFLEEQLEERREEIKARLHAIAQEIGEADEKGSLYVGLTSPVETKKATYKGFVRRKKIKQELDEDKARELLEKRGLTDRVIKQRIVEYVDQTELWALQQEGLLTLEEVESLITTRTYYALEKLT